MGSHWHNRRYQHGMPPDEWPPLSAPEQASVASMYRYVRTIVWRYGRVFERSGITPGDLLGPATFALIHAVRTYDQTRGPLRPHVRMKVCTAISRYASWVSCGMGTGHERGMQSVDQLEWMPDVHEPPERRQMDDAVIDAIRARYVLRHVSERDASVMVMCARGHLYRDIAWWHGIGEKNVARIWDHGKRSIRQKEAACG